MLTLWTILKYVLLLVSIPFTIALFQIPFIKMFDRLWNSEDNPILEFILMYFAPVATSAIFTMTILLLL